MSIKSYTSVAASNTSLFPENMAMSALNDGMRQVQADMIASARDGEWRDLWNDTPSRASATSFKITSDVTDRYIAGRRLRLLDATTLYGTVASASYSAPDTTINVTMDSGSLTTSLTSVAIGILSPTNRSFPSYNFDTLTVSGAAQFQGTVSISGATDLKTTLTVEGATTLSGAVRLSKTLTVDGESTFSGTVNFLTTPIFNNLAAAGTFSASGAAVFTTTVSVGGETTLSGTVTMKTVVTGAAVADQSAMELATATNRIVSPGNFQYHPGASKAWAKVSYSSGTPTADRSYNISSITDQGVGDITFVIGTDFSDSNYAVTGIARVVNPGNKLHVSENDSNIDRAAGSNRIIVTEAPTTTPRDPAVLSIVYFGDQ
jgi:cytoskeletal protein CcmA (bactofilin family)